MMFLRKLAASLARTPLHPQWLLGRRDVPKGLTEVRGTVLDIGSADAWIAEYLDASVNYVSVDIPSIGKTMYGSRPKVFADGRNLPFNDASIDAVICLEVAEHVDKPQRLFAEISRVLKPGAVLFFSMPFLYPIHDAPYDFQRFTRHGLDAMVTQAGLKVLVIENKTGSIHVAGALACLAISGVLSKGGWKFLLLPVAMAVVLLINVSAFTFGLFWPNWDAMTFGYTLQAVKSDTND